MKIYDILLKNGTIIDPSNKINSKLDIAISSTKIAKVSKSIDESKSKQTIDAKDLELTAQFAPIPVDPPEEEEDDLLWLWILIAVVGSLCLFITMCCMCPGQVCTGCRDSMGYGGCGPCLDDGDVEIGGKP